MKNNPLQNVFLFSLLEGDLSIYELAKKHGANSCCATTTVLALQKDGYVDMQTFTPKELARGKQLLEILLKVLANELPAKALKPYKDMEPAKYHITVKGIMRLIELEDAA